MLHRNFSLDPSAAANPPALTICIATETYFPEVNGVAMTLGQLVTGLQEKGHHIQLICPRRADRQLDANNGALSVIYGVGLPIPGYSELRFGLPAAGNVRRVWRDRQPDIIYIATEGPLGRSVLKTAQKRAIPVISGFHTNFQAYSKHYRFKWLEGLVMAYLKNFHNQTLCTLVPTPEMQTMLHNEGINNVDVMGRGVDTRLFSPDRRDPLLRHQWGLGPENPAIIYVGRIAPEKNIQLAVRTFQQIKTANPGAKFILIGDGPMKNELAREHPDFIFCGMQRGESLARHYASGDVFLFPSLTETFGNVVLEALASGLAVVAFDYAAARLHVSENISGLVAAVGRESDFLSHAMRLSNCRNFMESIRVNARRQALNNDWCHVVDRFESLLQQYALAKNN